MFLLKTQKSQIIQHNQILMGGQNIWLRARQLMYVLAVMMDPKNPLGEINIRADQFLEFINTGNKRKWTNVYSLTKDILKHLNQNPILIKKENSKDYKQINWLGSLGVEKGYIVAQLSPSIANYFVYQKGLPYTKVLWDLRIYKSAHTARILDLLQKHHLEKEFTIDLGELKFFFGVHNKYPNFADFRKRVLDPSKEELLNNIETPFYFDYVPIKVGRKISAIRFELSLREEILKKLIPTYTPMNINGQLQLHTTTFIQSLSDKERSIFYEIVNLRTPQPFAQMVMEKFTPAQTQGYLALIRYGVNYTLARDIVSEYCLGSEITDREDQYVQFVLDNIEQARLKRIKDVEAGKSKKRTTPKDKRGALPKKVFKERQYFSVFMETLSKNKKQKPQVRTQKKGEDFERISDLLSQRFKKD